MHTTSNQPKKKRKTRMLYTVWFYLHFVVLIVIEPTAPCEHRRSKQNTKTTRVYKITKITTTTKSTDSYTLTSILTRTFQKAFQCMLHCTIPKDDKITQSRKTITLHPTPPRGPTRAFEPSAKATSSGTSLQGVPSCKLLALGRRPHPGERRGRGRVPCRRRERGAGLSMKMDATDDVCT